MTYNTIYLQSRDLPEGYGAFDEDQLYERAEDVNECTECNGHGSDETISDCCGATRDSDSGLCHECHDHCGPSECPDCNGTGILTK